MMNTRSIAVIGAGPKGLYCLERLATELGQGRAPGPLDVHIFEPHPFPGAGPVYDPTQPDFLRMNFANSQIDMWPRDICEQEIDGPCFVDFLAERGEEASHHGYAPRRLVGAYLHEGFIAVVESLRQFASVTVHPEAVQTIESRGRAFEVRTATRSVRCTDVLLATGHGSRSSTASTGITAYPIDRPGGVSDIGGGSTVAVRGMGLTAIDVALALTEGRGGRFVATATPGRFRYQRSGFEVDTIFPFSRTGRPMTPKPHPGHVPQTDAVVAACAQGERAIAAIGSGGIGAVVDVLVETSAALLRHATGQARADEHVQRHLEHLLARLPMEHREVIDEMRASVEVAFGLRRPGPDWALGTAWRGVYPALVRRVGERRLDDDWVRFSALATEMERVAFGPPAENAARLLALVDAGIVDLGLATDPDVDEVDGGGVMLRSAATMGNADVLVEAVLDPPGAAPDPSRVVESVLAAGLARTTAHSSGLDVRPDGTCIGVTGAPTFGLAAVGRPTEGSILGNDTLSRRLHDTPALWARATMERLRLPMESSAA